MRSETRRRLDAVLCQMHGPHRLVLVHLLLILRPCLFVNRLRNVDHDCKPTWSLFIIGIA